MVDPSPAAFTRLRAGFAGLGDRVLSTHDVRDLLATRRDEWRLPQTLRPKQAIDHLLAVNQLRTITLPSVSAKYRPITRYTQGDPRPFDVAISIGSGGYLSHASAVVVHGLTQQLPATIYVNREQSRKPKRAESLAALDQSGLDRAFRVPQRRTNQVFRYGEYSIAILSGKNTGRLEVIPIDDGEYAGLDVTSIERTLIDIAVRPDYAGGVAQVFQAYRNAKGRFSANRLVATLRRLDYTYPYHQAIGFYLDRAGYPALMLDELRSIGIRFDFYLAHGLKDLALDPSWRVHHPKWM